MINLNFSIMIREKRKEKDRDELWKRLTQLELNHKAKLGSSPSS